MSRTLAIHWDQRILRIATAEIGDRVRVENLASFPLSDASDAAEISQIVSSFMARVGFTRMDASVVIGRGQLEFRVIELPAAPDDELPDLVRYQAKNHFSSTTDGQIIDFIRLVNGSDAAPIHVLAAALGNQEIKKIFSVLESSKVRVKHLLPRPFALANLLRQELTAPKYYLLINCFGQEVDLTVTYRSRIIFTRTIRLPVESSEQAQALVTEIRRTTSAAASQPSGGPIQKILVVGETKTNRDFAQAIERQLRLPVEIRRLADFVSLTAAAAKAMGEDDGSFGPLLGSLGLASEPSEHLIDFAVPHRRKEVAKDPYRRQKIAAVAVGISVLALAFVWFLLGQRRSEFSRLDAQLRALNADSESRDVLIGKVDAIDRWKLGDFNWLDELYEISVRFPSPDDAIVTQLSASIGSIADEATINVDGMISEPKVDNDLVQELRERPYKISQGKTSPLSDNKIFSRSFGLRLALPLSQRNVNQLLQPKNQAESGLAPADDQLNPPTTNTIDPMPSNPE